MAEVEETHKLEVPELMIDYLEGEEFSERFLSIAKATAVYCMDTDSLYFNLGCSPMNLEAPLLSITTTDANTVKGTVVHEIGHRVTDVIVTELKEHGGFHEGLRTNYHLVNCVFEGIGAYFENESGEGLPYKPRTKLENELDPLFDIDLNYMTGLQAVEPILNHFGTEQGIIQIFTHPLPLLDELIHPEQYHERILEATL
ncbi:MAG: hypothetical protein ABIH34_04830 [Nanoarchaeota archaeon]